MKLLHHLLPTEDVDALLGDITEEARHRSRLWYWGQILAVLVVGSWREVRRHPLIAVRAIGTGSATCIAFNMLVGVVFRFVNVLSNGGYYVFGRWITLPYDVFPRYPAAIVFELAIAGLGFALSGWVLARTHRTHGIAMVLLFLVIVTPVPLAKVTIMAILTRTSYFFIWRMVPAAALLVVPAAGILIGGMLGLGRDRGRVLEDHRAIDR